MAEPLQVTTSTDSVDEARRLARWAVERRLAACAQVVGPMETTYRWQGDVQRAKEWLVVLKTTTARFGDLQAYLVAEHHYETPEIVATPIAAGSAAYLEWVAAETAEGPI